MPIIGSWCPRLEEQWVAVWAEGGSTQATSEREVEGNQVLDMQACVVCGTQEASAKNRRLARAWGQSLEAKPGWAAGTPV